ncbi:MAG: ATPase, partial [Treponemataceae bacterium]|nr:ATPase [Treponemataceae bacterium]
MIVPMKKVSFVVLNAEKKEALINLRKVGVVHLETLEGSGQNLANLKEAYSDLQVSSMMLDDIKLDKKQSKALKPIEVSKDEAVAKAREVLDLNAKIKDLTDGITALSKEYDRLQAWQGFNPKDFDYLAEKGIHLLPYEVSKDVYFKKMPDTIDKIYVNSDKSKVRFLVLSQDGSKPEDMVSEALPVQMSEISTDEMQ